MAPKRPTAALVMAILNLIYGGLGLLGMCCGGLLIGVVFAVYRPPAGQADPVQQMIDMGNGIKGFWALQIAGVTVWLIRFVILTVTGVGLLRVRPWARMTCIWFPIVSFPIHLAFLWYQLAVQPAAMKEYLEKHPQPFQQGNSANNLMGVGVSVLIIAYEVILLAIMFLPSITDVFTRPSGPQPAEGKENG